MSYIPCQNSWDHAGMNGSVENNKQLVLLQLTFETRNYVAHLTNFIVINAKFYKMTHQ